jgi:hypothetical protein
MSRYRLLTAGLLMVGAGAFLIFSSPQELPLWFIWLAGPLLWYAGIAISIGGVAWAFFLRLTSREPLQKRRQEAETFVLKTSTFDRGPSSGLLVREVPSMGAFIM